MNKTILQIGAKLYPLLKSITPRVFPVIAPQETPAPLIVYRRNGLVVEGDNCDNESIKAAALDVVVITEDYAEGITLAEKAWGAVKSLELEGYRVDLEDANEEAIDVGSLYLQILSFKIEE